MTEPQASNGPTKTSPLVPILGVVSVGLLVASIAVAVTLSGNVARERDRAESERARAEALADEARRSADRAQALTGERDAALVEARERGAERDTARLAAAAAGVGLTDALARRGDDLLAAGRNAAACALYAAALASGESARARSGYARAVGGVRPLRWSTVLPLPARAAGLSPDGTRLVVRLAVADGADLLQVFDVLTGEQTGEASVPDAGCEGVSVNGVAASDGARVIAVATDIGNVHVLDVAGGRLIATLRASVDGGIGLSPDGTALHAGGQAIDVATGERRAADVLRDLTALASALDVTGVGAPSDLATIDSATVIVGIAAGQARVGLWHGEQTTPSTVRTVGGKKSSVKSATIDPAGAIVAVGTFEGVVEMREAADGRLRHRVLAHTDGASVAAVSPDGKLVASGGEDGAVRVFDTKTGFEVAAFGQIGLAVRALSWDGKSEQLVAGDTGGGIRLFDAKQSQELFAVKVHDGQLRAVQLSADGARLTTVGDDRAVRAFDLVGRNMVGEWKAWEVAAEVAALSRTSDRIAFAAADDETHAVTLLELASNASAALRGHGAKVTALAFSDDGARVASGDAAGRVMLWDAKTGARLADLACHRGTVAAVGFGGEGGALLITAGWDGTTRCHELTAPAPVARPLAPTTSPKVSAVGPDGRFVALATTKEPARVLDLAAADAKTDAAKTLRGHRRAIASLAILPDGKTVASGARDGSVYLCDATSGEQTARIEGHKGWVTALAADPTGRLIAAGADDGTVRVSEVESKRRLITMKAQGAWVTALAFSPDGKRLVSGGQDATVLVRAVGDAATLLEMTGHTGFIDAVDWSADGRWIATAGGDGVVRIRDAGTGAVVAAHRADGPLRTVAFHPGSGLLAAAGKHPGVTLLAVPSGRVVARLDSPAPETARVAFGGAGAEGRLGRLIIVGAEAEAHDRVVAAADLDRLGVGQGGPALRDAVTRRTGLGVAGLRLVPLVNRLRAESGP